MNTAEKVIAEYVSVENAEYEFSREYFISLATGDLGGFESSMYEMLAEDADLLKDFFQFIVDCADQKTHRISDITIRANDLRERMAAQYAAIQTSEC